MTNSQIADYYDAFLPHLERDTRVANTRHLMIFKTLDWLCTRKNGQDMKTVLDLGCGVGVTSLYMAKRGCKVTAVDLAPKLIEFAKANMAHPNVEYICMDIAEIPEGWPFDIVTMCDILEHIPEKRINRIMQKVKNNTVKNTVIYLNIPDCRFIRYMMAHYPEQLQIIDNPVDFVEILTYFEEIGFQPLEFHSRGISTPAQYTEYTFVRNERLLEIYDEALWGKFINEVLQ